MPDSQTMSNLPIEVIALISAGFNRASCLGFSINKYCRDSIVSSRLTGPKTHFSDVSFCIKFSEDTSKSLLSRFTLFN